MEESILITIKKMLGMEPGYTHFDQDIINHINTVLMTLTQIGVGPEEGFIIKDDKATWEEYLSDSLKFQAVKTYIYAKVRLVFDPPQSSTHIEVLKQTIAECEWRLNLTAES